MRLTIASILLPLVAASPIRPRPRVEARHLIQGRQYSSGSTVEYGDVLATTSVYLTESDSLLTEQNYTTIIVETSSSSSTSTLIAAWGGQPVYNLGAGYVLGIPTHVYAEWDFPDVNSSALPLKVCTYVYLETASDTDTASPSRSGFDVDAFASQLDLGVAIAEICVKVGSASSTTLTSTSFAQGGSGSGNVRTTSGEVTTSSLVLVPSSATHVSITPSTSRVVTQTTGTAASAAGTSITTASASESNAKTAWSRTANVVTASTRVASSGGARAQSSGSETSRSTSTVSSSETSSTTSAASSISSHSVAVSSSATVPSSSTRSTVAIPSSQVSSSILASASSKSMSSGVGVAVSSSFFVGSSSAPVGTSQASQSTSVSSASVAASISVSVSASAASSRGGVSTLSMSSAASSRSPAGSASTPAPFPTKSADSSSASLSASSPSASGSSTITSASATSTSADFTSTSSANATSIVTATNTTSPATATANATSTATVNATSTSVGPNPAYQTNVTFAGKTFINKGLVGFGAIAGDAVDSQGETIGGIGSAIALQSFERNGDSYSGVMVVQPDRGHNTATTTDYIARRHFISFTLNPYYNSTSLEYQSAKSTFQLTYDSSLLYYEEDGTPTTGLDATSYRNGTIIEPIANTSYNHISTDAEGIVLNADGSSWVSDEYGPYIWKYSADGKLLDTIVPPKAVLPYKNGSIYFEAEADNPDTGRVPNQGFEGLAISDDGKNLYALLQSGTVQDLNSSGEGRYTRLFVYDISGTPTLTHSYVVQLPVTSGKAKTLATSDLRYIGDGTLMLLSRDGKGNGNDDADSKHKDFMLFNIEGATDIVNTEYTTGTTAVSPGGVLDSSITAIVPTEFISIIDDTQLARFGLHNDGAFNVSLINSKWESSAIASVQDDDYPSDYFLFSFSDNDFITTKGYEDDASYVDSYGSTLDNQALVWRVTLP